MTAALCGLVVLAAYAGPLPLAAATLVAQGLFLGSWHRYVGAPGAAGGVAVGAATALGALAAGAAQPRGLTPVAAILGVALGAALLHQLCRRPPRERVVASLTATATGAVLVGLGALLLPAAQTRVGAALLAAALAGVAFAALALAGLPALLARRKPGRARAGYGTTAIIGVLAGALAGAAAAGLGGTVDPLLGVLAGAVGAVGAVVAAVPVERPVLSRPDVVRLPVAGALPVLLAGPTAYVLATFVTA